MTYLTLLCLIIRMFKALTTIKLLATGGYLHKREEFHQTYKRFKVYNSN